MDALQSFADLEVNVVPPPFILLRMTVESIN